MAALTADQKQPGCCQASLKTMHNFFSFHMLKKKQQTNKQNQELNSIWMPVYESMDVNLARKIMQNSWSCLDYWRTCHFSQVVAYLSDFNSKYSFITKA